jgi:hypothetical protein
MTKYFGVECKTCEKFIPLAIYRIDEGSQVTFYPVPLEPVPCPACGKSHRYDRLNSKYIDGPDGLLELFPPEG